MMAHSPAARRRLLAAGSALVLLIAGSDAARAQVKFEAGYTISAARIPVGSIALNVEIADGEYTATMSGRGAGLMRLLTSGEGNLTARGILKDGQAQPTRYQSKTTSDDDTLDVTMTIEDGNVTELAASAPPPSNDRVPIADAHRKTIVDPLSAFLVPATEPGDGVSPVACQRTLPVFDGRRRYDLKLAFKRIDRVRTDKGYAGPVVVCALVLVPIAGHRRSSAQLKYLDGREIELALAPIAGTRLLAPFRIAIANMLGNLVMQATRFETLAPSAVRAAVPAEPKAE
jgi:Protein of unknown function (DUF3108)